MPRKSEQQITLEEQHRLWMGKLRKARTLQQQATIAKILKDIEARLWPNPVDEAAAVAKATKLQLKAGRVAAAQAKKAEAEELERLKAIERQKIRDEANPVTEQLKRGRVQAEIAAISTLPPLPTTTETELAPVTTVEVEASDVPVTHGVVLSPELTTITREAQEAAKRYSSTRQDDGLLDFFKKVSEPFESRDVAAPLPTPRRFLADSESSGPGETNARLAASEHAREARALSPENQGMELVTDWAGNQEWRKRGQE